jgi:hypothetical protein
LPSANKRKWRRRSERDERGARREAEEEEAFSFRSIEKAIFTL